MLKRKLLLLLIPLLLVSFTTDAYSQKKPRKKKTNTTEYKYGERYKTTGYTKVKRNQSAKKEFLRSKGYKKVPSGFEVDHIIPLSKGGTDTPDNMQLISKENHKKKTANERHSTKKTTTKKKSYKKKQ